MKYNNLFYNKTTNKYYKIDMTANALPETKNNKCYLRFLFRPVRKKLFFLVEDGLGFYDYLSNYKQVSHYGDK